MNYEDFVKKQFLEKKKSIVEIDESLTREVLSGVTVGYGRKNVIVSVPFFKNSFGHLMKVDSYFINENLHTRRGRSPSLIEEKTMLFFSHNSVNLDTLNILLNIGFGFYNYLVQKFKQARGFDLFVTKDQYEYRFSIAESKTGILEEVYSNISEHRIKFLSRLIDCSCNTDSCFDCFPVNRKEYKQYSRKGWEFRREIIIRSWGIA